MQIEAHETLRPLGDTPLTTRSPSDDIRSPKVFAANGDEIGKVDELLIDDREQRVRFIRVASGGILGIGRSKSLLPVDAIQRIEAGAVHVNQTREHIAAAPRMIPSSWMTATIMACICTTATRPIGPPDTCIRPIHVIRLGAACERRRRAPRNSGGQRLEARSVEA